MNRREFLKHQARVAALVAVGGGGLLLPGRSLAAGPEIGIAKGKPAAATRAAVELLGGMAAFVKPGQRVVIKPNMSFADPPERATTTHPEVVKTLAAMCKEAGAADVLVLDHTLRPAEMCLERSGIRDACEPVASDMVHGLSSPSFFVETEFPRAREMKKNEVMKDVLRADVLIAAPVAKSHGATGISLSMKGMMGLVWDRGAMHRLYDLHQAIVDLNTRVTADLAVIDGTRVLTTNGPSGPGKVMRENTVIASADFVAADAKAVSMFQWWGRRLGPENVEHIRLAHKQGLGRMDVENLRTETVEL
jgi:uncharacterized protein (DUF362 family)